MSAQAAIPICLDEKIWANETPESRKKALEISAHLLYFRRQQFQPFLISSGIFPELAVPERQGGQYEKVQGRR